MPALNGEILQVFWNDQSRFLNYATEWVNYAGGGFTVTIPGFNSADAVYTFYVYSQD
jgi:hypothetical protein